MAFAEDQGPKSHSAYLPLERAHTRIARIRQGSFSDPLELELIHVDLNDLVPNLRHRYSAISYTWGDNYEFVEADITCQAGCRHRLKITDSAQIALRHLRSPCSDSDVWIDQLSIDQSNDSEKAKQIALMRTIFERAAKVVIWLGPASEESDEAFEHIKLAQEKAWSMSETNPAGLYDPDTSPGYGYLSPDTLLGLLGTSPNDINAWTAVERLLRRKWFTRAWVVQEATAVPEVDTYLFCGSKQVQRFILHLLRDIFFAIEFRALSTEYSYLRGSQAFFDSVLSMLNFGVARNRLPGGRPILSLLSAIRPFNVTDPRDKIFTMLNFACDIDQGLVPIDYKKTTDQVYTDFAICYLQRSHNLDLLSHGGMQQFALGETPRSSWIPDWSQSLPSTPFSMLADADVETSASLYRASGPLVPLCIIHTNAPGSRPRVLSVVGIRLADLSDQIFSFGDASTPQGILNQITVDDRTLQYQLRDDRISLKELLTRVMFADCDRIALPNAWISQRIGDVTRERIQNITTQFNPFQFRRTIRGRALFVTSPGAMSACYPQSLLVLCPQSAEQGDEIWMLRGGRVFYVMRRRPPVGDVDFGADELVLTRSEMDPADINNKPKQNAPYYRYIGEAYIHGLMDGELLSYVEPKPVQRAPPAFEKSPKEWTEIYIE